MSDTSVEPVNDARRRHDFVLLFDVEDGNPNGDPDAGNLPRIDPVTMQGLVSDVCLKRKIRNWVDLAHGDQERYKIYVQDKGVALNEMHQRAYTALGLKSTGSKQPRADVERVQDWMCANFYDVRAFGAVMSTDVSAGKVTGPVQLVYARSLDEIDRLKQAITRVAVTRAEAASVVVSENGKGSGGKVTEMGSKTLVPYGLYRCRGFVVPSLAARTGFSDEDLALFWQALQHMWDVDHSAARGLMSCRGLYVFSHENPLGSAPAHTLFDRIRIGRVDAEKPPRSFHDYRVLLDDPPLPEGVILTCLVHESGAASQSSAGVLGRNGSEYLELQRRCAQGREVAERQREAFVAAGLAPDEVDRAMEPLLSFNAQLDEEIARY